MGVESNGKPAVSFVQEAVGRPFCFLKLLGAGVCSFLSHPGSDWCKAQDAQTNTRKIDVERGGKPTIGTFAAPNMEPFTIVKCMIQRSTPQSDGRDRTRKVYVLVRVRGGGAAEDTVRVESF